ncbi:CaiB/BaiF CoA-transferase family protein [Sphingomonas sp. 3P27F8]|jgi:crotonobetainyl-CoA:carnitine CoA-transferase CaiB-like acyl-CoA transferase|uniref:CaiB/BaiF CoA transferase family protein n=1 Tax=Sphingomonas sp. 3P27F8 TaxID=2502213 RepID=UPI0010F756A7|nr:CaiB/BaiF CoA-transferase family protein [Sphingomonas sp. 3P27F8]
MSGALSHIRVLDLSRVLAGPWASQTLADMGAEVIKIERPGSGDDTRGWGPPYLKDLAGNDTREAAYYLAANRGKQSVTLNISKPEGQEVIRRLVKECDVFIENYKVGDMARYGLSYDELKKINPRLIYCSITGFGQTGPMAHLPGYDFIIQGIGGLMSITGERDDLPGGGPQKVGVAVADIMTGLYTTIGILGALAYRNQTGEGQYVDMALLDVQVATMANMNMNYLCSGKVPHRQGNAHANIVPYQVFDAKDGELIIAAGNDSQFAKLCEVIGCPEMAADELYATNANRVRNREVLIPLLQEILSRRRVAEWIALIEPEGVPCGPINNIGQVFEHPQVRHRGMRIDLPHPVAGSTPSVANPIKFSGTPIEYTKAPPTLGQHTKHVLSSIGGLSESEIRQLIEKGII